MRAVDLHVSRARLGDSLGEMREWLDQNGCTPEGFDTRTEPETGTVLVHVEFEEDDVAIQRSSGTSTATNASADLPERNQR
jgi:hypothetical protein